MKKYLIVLVTAIIGSSQTTNAYRDLETGTFLTRDPIGYADGPNIYCYVHCNPITQFDPLGLKYNWIATSADKQEAATQVATAQALYQATYDQASPELQATLDGYAAEDGPQINIELTSGDPKITIGSYNAEKIDLGDINALPQKDSPMTQSAAFGHEIVEQGVKQSKGLKNTNEPEGKEDFLEAHTEGLKAETDLNGGFERRGGRKVETDPKTGTKQSTFHHQRNGEPSLFGTPKEAFKTTMTETADGETTVTTTEEDPI